MKDDLDVVCQIRKVNMSGERLLSANYTVPVRVQDLPDVNAGKYLGPSGVLRASHYTSLIPKAHPDDFPTYNHRSMKPIVPGTIIGIEIPIWPLGMVIEAGEGIHIRIADHDMVLPEAGPLPSEPIDFNKGKFTVHTGSQYESYLMLPFIEG